MKSNQTKTAAAATIFAAVVVVIATLRLLVAKLQYRVSSLRLASVAPAKTAVKRAVAAAGLIRKRNRYE